MGCGSRVGGKVFTCRQIAETSVPSGFTRRRKTNKNVENGHKTARMPRKHRSLPELYR